MDPAWRALSNGIGLMVARDAWGVVGGGRRHDGARDGKARDEEISTRLWSGGNFLALEVSLLLRDGLRSQFCMKRDELKPYIYGYKPQWREL
jgi:hypothetical protein